MPPVPPYDRVPAPPAWPVRAGLLQSGRRRTGSATRPPRPGPLRAPSGKSGTVSPFKPRPYLFAKGIRDIASGLFAAMLIAYGSAHALGWFMLIATIIPIGDAAIVLQQGGRRAVAFGVHGGTAAAMVIISGLLLFD